ncbi:MULTISPECIES: 3-phosphoshikimate 1-carboxyvinyltransferase [unclassified Marinobacterium]|uniref:3-phosphoshikimate 1-carboxyvinyltransferase n=1 Tax=unclassified Marinobacterium TaxID=2644139 RepID=UPI001567F3C7|nr:MULTISPECIES: 3-phosphoshikimate 1-carboxyvinyltransferase [unclassified Marinobacterium]NRP47427.1 hypothetical protein [Marinobacterium sp. xm-d-543]NRQ23472.1 hypothetical protein [Marinobacterium sp. xm-m-312]
MDKRGEVFAEFTMSRIPKEIRDSLSEVQRSAIRQALIGMDQSARHTIDIRFTIPLVLRTYYFVLFAGRDRRNKTLSSELARIHRLPRWFRRGIYLTASAVIGFAIFSTLFTVLYLIKSRMGIDIFPNFHLHDVLPFDIYLMPGQKG